MCEVLTITPSRKSHVVNAVVMLGSVCVCVSVCARAARRREIITMAMQVVSVHTKKRYTVHLEREKRVTH